jgi:diketogulonate reductase-like aldo/keto reductase
MQPSFIYGTAWKEERTEALVATALAQGFRCFDTANQRKHYFEEGMGAALSKAVARGEVRRNELWIQTKFTFVGGQDHRLPYDRGASHAAQVRQSVQSSLQHLGTDYVDSLVLHGPSQRPGLGDADWEAWGALEEQHAEGNALAIGVSNVTLEQLTALWNGCVTKPSTVQNRCYASTGWDAGVRGFCEEHGLVYQGFSLLTANRSVWGGAVVGGIAEGLGATPAQVLYAFARQVGMVPLTGTTDARHMREALESWTLELTEAERMALRGVGLH